MKVRGTYVYVCVVEGRGERGGGREGRGGEVVEATLLIQSSTNWPHLQRRCLFHQMSLSRSLLSGGGS